MSETMEYYVDIANQAQKILGRGVRPSTVKVVLQVANEDISGPHRFVERHTVEDLLSDALHPDSEQESVRSVTLVSLCLAWLERDDRIAQLEADDE